VGFAGGTAGAGERIECIGYKTIHQLREAADFVD